MLVGALGAADLAQEGTVAARMPLPPIGVVSPPGNGVPGRGDTPAKSDTRGRAEPAKGNGETAPRAVHASRAGTAGSARAEEPQTHRRPADDPPALEADPTSATGAGVSAAAGVGAAAIAAGASGATAVAAAAGEAEPPRRQRRHSAPPEPESETEPADRDHCRPRHRRDRPSGYRNRRRSVQLSWLDALDRRGCRVAARPGATFSVAELAGASGLDVAGVEELESFGLIAGRVVEGVACYDEEAVHGREARGPLRAVRHRGAAPPDLQARRRSPDGALRPGDHAAA